MKAVLLLCLVTYVACQVPRPCVSPKQWQSRAYTRDRSKGFTEIAKITYDETNQRVRIIEEVEVGSTRDYYDKLYLHNIQKEYSLNLKTRQCNVTALTRPFRPMGVPLSALFQFEAEVGPAAIANEHMTIQSFSGEFEDKSKYFVEATVPDCAPILFDFFSNETGFVSRTFFGMDLGIDDPMVFIPPRECMG